MFIHSIIQEREKSKNGIKKVYKVFSIFALEQDGFVF